MRLLFDENVPESVVEFFRSRGHEIRYVRTDLLPGTPDPIVAAAAEYAGAVLVSWDKDFDKIAPRIPDGLKTRFRSLSRISFDCKEPRACALLDRDYRHIELEYTLSRDRPSKRMLIVIQESGIKIVAM